MKRLLRPLATSLTLLSLAFCAGFALLWHRSYAEADFVGRGTPARWYGALSMSGLIRVERGDYLGGMDGWSRDSYPTPDRLGLRGEVEQRDTRRFGPVAFRHIRYDARRPRWSVYVPHWLAVVLAAALPAAHVTITWRRRRRQRPGHCAECGYDMRATPRRCPECGMRAT